MPFTQGGRDPIPEPPRSTMVVDFIETVPGFYQHPLPEYTNLKVFTERSKSSNNALVA
jgi:hypothetical protein